MNKKRYFAGHKNIPDQAFCNLCDSKSVQNVDRRVLMLENTGNCRSGYVRMACKLRNFNS